MILNKERYNIIIDGTSPDGTYDLDWEYVEGLGNLDSCNGGYVDGEYAYFITESFPYGPRCLNGEVASQGGPGGNGPGQNGGTPPLGASGQQGGKPPIQ